MQGRSVPPSDAIQRYLEMKHSGRAAAAVAMLILMPMAKAIELLGGYPFEPALGYAALVAVLGLGTYMAVTGKTEF